MSEYGYYYDDAGFEVNRSGRRIKRCPNCDRPREIGWSDVCKNCKGEYKRKQDYLASAEYTQKVKEYHASRKYVP